MILFFYGDNTYAVRAKIDAIARRYEQTTGSSYSLDSFDMSERTLGDLLNAVAIQPLFESSRLIIVKELGSNKVAREQIEQIIDSIPETSNVIIWEREIDKRSSYFKKLAKLKKAQEFKMLDRPKLVRWIKQTSEDYGYLIEVGAINRLIELVGFDQWQLKNELIKLGNYNEHINTESVELLVTSSIEQTIFQLIDAIWSGNVQGAVRIYNTLLLQGSSDQQILAMFNWQLRNLVLAKESSGDYSRISREFGISPYVLRRSAQSARMISFAQLKQAYARLIETDFAIKSGRLNSKSALEGLIIELASS